MNKLAKKDAKGPRIREELGHLTNEANDKKMQISTEILVYCCCKS